MSEVQGNSLGHSSRGGTISSHDATIQPQPNSANIEAGATRDISDQEATRVAIGALVGTPP